MVRIDLSTQFTDVRARVASQPTTPVGAVASDGPRYRRLTRKETLLRADQLESLAALARLRMRQRRVRTERITENTLVRIAVDLLLDNQDLLDGSTEEELSDAILRRVASLGGQHRATTPLEAPRPSDSVSVSEHPVSDSAGPRKSDSSGFGDGGQ